LLIHGEAIELDENYQTYLNRVMRMTLPETYGSQVQHIQESPKFKRLPDQGWQASDFPGYTVVTPCGTEDRENKALFDRLTTYQAQVIQKIGGDRLAAVPPESFHLTLADLIWDGSYRHAKQENPDFEGQLRDRIAQSFQQCAALSHGQPVRFQVLGLIVMTRAVAVCLAPTDEESYDRILKLRRAIYQNPEVIAIGIEQQYYFTPHITLGYFGDISGLEGDRLSQTFEDLNKHWLEESAQEFLVHQAQLRKFDNMTHYYRDLDWPAFKF
jgi:hypothetical protein